MKQAFNTYAPIDTAEEYFKRYGIAYGRVKGTGELGVARDLNISYRDPALLPDFSDVVVLGNFSCANAKLTSLERCPKIVNGNYDCSGNFLSDLNGAPREIYGSFDASSNYCLTSLEGGPETVAGNYDVSSCRLQTLDGAPVEIGGYFKNRDNRLISLEHAPAGCTQLYTDFGVFHGNDDIPPELLSDSATVAPPEEDTAPPPIEDVAALTSPLPVHRPLQLNQNRRKV